MERKIPQVGTLGMADWEVLSEETIALTTQTSGSPIPRCCAVFWGGWNLSLKIPKVHIAPEKCSGQSCLIWGKLRLNKRVTSESSSSNLRCKDIPGGKECSNTEWGHAAAVKKSRADFSTAWNSSEDAIK